MSHRHISSYAICVFSIAVFPGYSIAVMAYYAMSDWYKAMKGTDVNVIYKMLKVLNQSVISLFLRTTKM